MKVVALDIATSTGVCVGISGGVPASRTVHLGKPPNARRFSNVLHLTSELITEHSPDLVVIEAPIGGKTASKYLIGLVACAEGVCFNRGVRCEIAVISTVRKHFIGKNLTVRDFPALREKDAKTAIKQEVMRRCNLLGWKPNTHDEGDSMAIWDWACATFSGAQASPSGELFVGRE